MSLSPVDQQLLLYASLDATERTLANILVQLPQSAFPTTSHSSHFPPPIHEVGEQNPFKGGASEAGDAASGGQANGTAGGADGSGESVAITGPRLPHRDLLLTSHRSSHLLDLITSSSLQLSTSHRDPTGELAEEVSKLSGGGGGGDLAEFYLRLGKVKEMHRKYPGGGSAFSVPGLGGAVPQSLEDRENTSTMISTEPDTDPEYLDHLFTGEEMLGRYLDLNESYEKWCNLGNQITSSLGGSRRGVASGKGAGATEERRGGYLGWLDEFDKFERIPRNAKTSEGYYDYLSHLLLALTSFLSRSRPLFDQNIFLLTKDDEFDNAWDNSDDGSGKVKGWEEEANSGGNGEEKSEGVWCAACQKLYSKQTVYDGHLSSKKHKKAAESLASSPAPNGTNGTSNGINGHSATSLAALRKEKSKPTARLEFLIRALVTHPSSPLPIIRSDTKSNVERRSALTDKERQAEVEEMEAKEAAEIAAAAEREGAGKGKGKRDNMDEDEEEEDRIYNPLKLPLGWDGKPIPYWLYKLHGLGVEYRCEICSDHVYMGRKNFERHFQESRHAFGMRALGLPNTKHFHEITRIEDAIGLAEKLKAEGKQEVFHNETVEELEDEEGNVYNRKTFEDLRRQGLL